MKQFMVSFFLLAFYLELATAGVTNLSQYDGLSFAQSGPNCFGAALKLAGHYPTFRGVDAGEFETFLQLACVVTERPERGDIGVYIVPNFGIIHAFLYVNSEIGMDKHNPKNDTIVQFRDYKTIDYHYLAPLECRQYSPNNLELCSNEKVFYRCNSEKVKNLASAYQKLVKRFESQVALVLNREHITQSEKSAFEEELKELQAKLSKELSKGKLSKLEAAYLTFQLESLVDQVAYLN